MHLTSRPLAHVFRVSEKILLKWPFPHVVILYLLFFILHRTASPLTELNLGQIVSNQNRKRPLGRLPCL